MVKRRKHSKASKKDDKNREEECSVCLDKKCNMFIDCNHKFCDSCIIQVIFKGYKCPLCRRKFSIVRGINDDSYIKIN